MTPEERLEEAHKQLRLAAGSDLNSRPSYTAIDRALTDTETALKHLEMAREETDDAEVVE